MGASAAAALSTSFGPLRNPGDVLFAQGLGSRLIETNSERCVGSRTSQANLAAGRSREITSTRANPKAGSLAIVSLPARYPRGETAAATVAASLFR